MMKEIKNLGGPAPDSNADHLPKTSMGVYLDSQKV